MKYSSFSSLASILPATYGLAQPGPQPTAGGPERAIGGIAPATTAAPSVEALEKRQQNIINPLCGWVDGDWESALTCSSSRTCMLYKSAAALGMAGCCLGSNFQNCGWANSCVPYAQMTAGNCNSNCVFNSFVRKCTNSAAPYCVTYTYQNDGIRDYDCGTANTIYTVKNSASDPTARQTRTIRLSTVAAAQVTGIQQAAEVGKKAVKLAIGAIVGIVVAALFLIFCVVIGICICLKRKKKQKALAQNAQIVASSQANRQSQYQPHNVQQSQPLLQQHGMPPPQQQQQQQMMPGQPYASPPMPSQSPAPQMGYFPPAGQKFDGHTSVHEYAMSPISNPPTPAPAYSQPYVAQNAPPMPQQVPHQQPPPGVVAPMQQYRAPAGGAVEVDAVSVPHMPGQTGPPGQPGQPGPHVYEMGQGR